MVKAKLNRQKHTKKLILTLIKREKNATKKKKVIKPTNKSINEDKQYTLN